MATLSHLTLTPKIIAPNLRMKHIIHTSMSTLDSKITAHRRRQQENKIAKLKLDDNVTLLDRM
jgi:hypothetical protein